MPNHSILVGEVHPPDLTDHHSYLGLAICEGCETEWPCHLSAWGNPNNKSKCNICGSIISFHFIKE